MKITRYVFLLIIPISVYANFNFSKDFSFKSFKIDQFSKRLSHLVFDSEKWPSNLKVNERNYKLDYTINKKLEDEVRKYLKRYRSDYSSVVIIDNNTGKILTAVDYDKKERNFGVSLAFSTTNPAASLFKVITAADLLENTNTSKDTKFSYSGRASTLYKYQLKDRKNKWTRSIPFKRAFARSNNVIFGKAAIKKTSTSSLIKTANKFGFNNDLLQLLDVGESKLLIAESDYALAELASGFNKKTMISPIHGALIASVVANDGVLKMPTIINNIIDTQQEREVWRSNYKLQRVISEDVANELQEMMRLTVSRGTARGAFRPWKTRKIQNIEIGGKTGSITGGVPFGKRDWFISYAKPKNNSSDKGISICVMIVNVKKWYIKSTYLAKKIIQYYYDDLKSSTGS